MSLSPSSPSTATAEATAKTWPSAITRVNYLGTPSSEGSNWRTDTPKKVYTAPSDCSYARIYFHAGGRNEISSNTAAVGYANNTYFQSDNSSRWYGIGVSEASDDTLIDFIYSSSQPFHINGQQQNISDASSSEQLSSGKLEKNDFIITRTSYKGSSIHFDGDRLLLMPGDSLILLTGSSSMSNALYLRFSAWEYS